MVTVKIVNDTKACLPSEKHIKKIFRKMGPRGTSVSGTN